MNVRAAGFRDASLLSAAVVLGACVAPALPFVGLPIVAAGVAGLVYRSKAAAAGFAAAVGVAAVFASQGIESLVFVALAIAAVLLGVALLPTRRAQSVGAGIVALLTLASFAELFLVAKGFDVSGFFLTEMQRSLKELGPSVSAQFVKDATEAIRTMSTIWPSAYFSVAVVTAVFVIGTIAWAGRRAGREINVPSLSRLDLTPHVLWAFVVGLLLLAASYAGFSASSAFGVVGLNLVLCARALFALQGVGVFAGVLDRTGVGLGGRILALAALAALDALTLSVSFVGLVDFWVNFRRLPRDGVTPAAPTEVDA